jgi:hypothetical protein
VSCALLVGAGCVTEPEPGDQEPVTTVAAQAKIPCDDPFCGNSPTAGGFPFWELDLSMTAYSPVGGFRIRSMTGALGGTLTPQVHGFNLVGRTAGGATVFVPNFTMQIEADTGEVYELTFANSGGFDYYENGKMPGDSLKPTYVIKYRRVDGDWKVLARKKADFPHTQWLSGKAALVAGLDRWQREVRALPSWRELQAWESDGICDTPTGHRVEPDGQGPDGVPSWLRLLHLI